MTATDEREHVRSEAGLLEVAVRGERLGQSVSVHDHEREAICQAPVLVGAAPVQSDRGITEFGLKRHDLDSPVGVNPAIAFRRDRPRARVRESVEPLPEYGLGRDDPACGPHDRLVPGGSLGMILIPSAGYGDPEGSVGEVGGHERHLSEEERP